MRYIIITLLFLAPCIGNTTVIAPANTMPGHLISVESSGPLRRFAEKMLPDRLKKISTSSSGNSYGLWLSVFGLFFGLIGILPYILAVEAALYISVLLAVLGLIGLPLSIFGLIKARRWTNNRVVKGIAIAGIVLNGLLFIGVLVAIILYHEE